MSRSKISTNQYKLKIAYPTIALTLSAIIAYTFASIATIQEYLGIGWAI